MRPALVFLLMLSACVDPGAIEKLETNQKALRVQAMRVEQLLDERRTLIARRNRTVTYWGMSRQALVSALDNKVTGLSCFYESQGSEGLDLLVVERSSKTLQRRHLLIPQEARSVWSARCK